TIYWIQPLGLSIEGNDFRLQTSNLSPARWDKGEVASGVGGEIPRAIQRAAPCERKGREGGREREERMTSNKCVTERTRKKDKGKGRWGREIIGECECVCKHRCVCLCVCVRSEEHTSD